MHPIWPAVGAGLLACFVGAAVIRWREPLAAVMRRAQLAMYGEAIRPISRKLTPRMLGLFGVGYIVFGVYGMVMGLFGLL